MPQKCEKLFNYPKSWNCITLQYKNRDVDLVITDEKDMKIFIKFLIFSLKTIDGKRGSAQKIVELLYNQEAKNFKK